MAQHDSFKAGDFIEVTAAYGTDDFGTIRGAAADSRGQTGDAYFDMIVTSDNTEQTLNFNLNRVNVKVLFVAKLARLIG